MRFQRLANEGKIATFIEGPRNRLAALQTLLVVLDVRADVLDSKVQSRIPGSWRWARAGSRAQNRWKNWDHVVERSSRR